MGQSTKTKLKGRAAEISKKAGQAKKSTTKSVAKDAPNPSDGVRHTSQDRVSREERDNKQSGDALLPSEGGEASERSSRALKGNRRRG